MSNSSRWIAAALALLALAGCRQAQPVTPALWQVDGPHGEKAWLFGTIHALPRPVAWRSAAVNTALAQADRIVLEVAEIDDQAALETSFAQLAAAPQPIALRTRLPANTAASFDRFVTQYKVDPAPLAKLDTWAAAIILAQAAQADAGSDSANGIDRAVKKAAGSRPVEEFEGADRQFRIFDGLPEADQRDLLGAVIADAGSARADTRALEQEWQRGDLAAMERETTTGMMADPELRAALLVQRNQAWRDQLVIMLARGQRPFVAVGTAHLAGPEGLPALLASRGYRVRRIQ
ncbi:TraB/GumN family protein [Novosphingobium sp.]|uniref:TraB/GumN family protein n=1 Tax=Novosphingobium sp. TaxID=1874826 RepID=UPI0025DD5C61|nr:TraB/GumN family protein [Novosphingobium sp.]